MESYKEADIGENVELPEGSLQEAEFVNVGEVESVPESISESKDEEYEYDAFNLDVSLAILDTEIDEVDTEFLEALTEIEGKKSFPCPNCAKVCKSKGGLTRHTNSKHRESDAKLSTESGNSYNFLLLEDLAGIVESIKTNLIAGDLYGPAINTAIKNASCSEELFAAVLPSYDKFCRKKNQDKFLEEFYGLFPNASKYLNCQDANAASIIMIEIPDRLAGFFKLRRIQHEELKTNKLAVTSDVKLDHSEHGPLSYIAGYIVSKLHQKSRNRKNQCDSELQALLQALKSTGLQDNEFILARSRGGLVAPSHHLMGIIEEAELCFRRTVREGELVLRSIPTDTICESTLSSPLVKSLWDNIVLEAGIDESCSTQKLCLESIVKLYLRVRSFSYARDYISKYKIREKQTKSKSLRKNLKRS